MPELLPWQWEAAEGFEKSNGFLFVRLGGGG
jgi:hypothetical protein